MVIANSGMDITQVSNENFLISLIPISAFIPVSAPQGNEILNTVLVIMALYFAYPNIRFVIKKRQGWRIVFLSAFAMSFSNMFLKFLTTDASWISRNFYAVLIYWVIGIYAADNYRKQRGKTPILVLIILSLLYILIGNLINFKGCYYFKTLYLSCLIGLILCSLCLREKKNRIHNQFLAWIGERSYSLYTTHLPAICIAVTAVSNIKNGFMVRIITLIFTFLCWLFCYHIIERPTHKFESRYPRLKP